MTKVLKYIVLFIITVIMIYLSGGTWGIALIGGGLAVFGQVVGQLLTPKPPSLDFDGAFGTQKQPLQSQQLNIRQPVPPRRAYFGRVKAGGVFAFLEARHGTLYAVVAVCSHEIDGIEGYYLGDIPVTINEDGEVTDFQFQYNDEPVVTITTRLGTDEQTAYQEIIDIFPDLWTSAHKGNGVHHALVQQRSSGVTQADFNQLYPGGAQTYMEIFRARKVFDPRDTGQSIFDETTWLWSNNPALCILHYLKDEDGLRIPLEAFIPVLGSWAQAANVCDEQVALKAGGTEARYALDGGYEFDRMPKDILPLLQSSCDGFIGLDENGCVILKPGKWEPPTITLGSDDIKEYVLRRGDGPLRDANEIRAQYTSPLHDYQKTDADPWRNDDDISLRGLLSQELNLAFISSHSRARRLMKLAALRSASIWKGTITTNIRGLNCLGQRFINVEIADLEISESFEIESFSINLETMQCSVGIRAFGSDTYDWDAQAEEGTAPALAPENEVNNAIPEPEYDDLSSRYGVDGIIFEGLFLTISPAPEDEDLLLRGQWRNYGEGDDDWKAYDVHTSPTEVRDSTSYPSGNIDIRAWYAKGGTRGDFTYILNVGTTYPIPDVDPGDLTSYYGETGFEGGPTGLILQLASEPANEDLELRAQWRNYGEGDGDWRSYDIRGNRGDVRNNTSEPSGNIDIKAWLSTSGGTPGDYTYLLNIPVTYP